MSEKWETVGNGKVNTNKGTKGKMNGTKAANGKKSEQKTYSVEEVLPASSVKNMYKAAFDPSPPSPKKDAKPSNGTKAEVKKSTEKKVDTKPKLPSSLAQAVKECLRVEDLKNLLETSQARFPDSPLLWLRDVATFLNQKLVTEPEVSVADLDLFGGDPASALTANMRKVINVMFQKCSDTMKETFLETSVANTAHELQKGLNVVGWNILTQLLTENNPSLVTAHIPRYIELRNSYQNRPNIGLAILWSVGQAGAKSLHSGIKVWLEIMLPVMTMKHYSKFVVNYLVQLLKIHKVTEATMMNKPVVELQNFLTIQDSVFIVANQINKEYARSLREVYPALRAICVAGCRNHEMFLELLPRLSSLAMPEQVLDCLDLLASCLSATPAARVHWHKMYTSNLPQSAQLIQYLDCNWSKYKKELDVPDFHDTLEAFQDYNSSVINKEGLDLASTGCNSLSGKFRRGGMSWFPWKTLSLLLLIGTGLIIHADIDRHQDLERSNIGQFLQDIGQFDRALSISWTVTRGYKDGVNWIERSAPLVMEPVGPYVSTVQHWAMEAAERLGEAKVAAIEKLEEARPGSKIQITNFGIEFAKFKEAAIIRVKEFLHTAEETTVLIINGKYDWAEAKAGALKNVEYIQEQIVAGVDYVKVQVKQMTSK